MRTYDKIIMLICCCFIGACSSATVVEEQIEQPVEVLYNDALDTVLNESPEKGAPKFEEVERQHPYSALAVRAQVMAAWSFYQAND